MTKARDIASAAPAPSTVSATELGYLDGVTSAVQTQLDAKTAKSTLTTTGDIYYASSANTPARLGIGSTGNVLTVASGVPSWAAPAGGGKVLQVVQGTTTTQTTTSSSTYTDTTLSATITPSSSSSKVLAIVSQPIQHELSNAGGGAMNAEVQLVRTSTGIVSWRFATRAGSYNNEINNDTIQSMSYLDTPATTSATTYKTQFRNTGSGSTRVQTSSTTAVLLLLEIGA
jgi:hypothetical protein